MKNIISCGININIFITSNNIIITMRSGLGGPCATWCLGGVAPRAVGAAIANLAFCHDPSNRWRWGLLAALSRQSARWRSGPPRSRVGSPKRQVALGFAQVPRGVGAGRNPSPLQPWKFCGWEWAAFAPGVCAWSCSTQCPHKLCNPQCNELWWTVPILALL